MPFLPAITGWVRQAPGPRATIHTAVSGREGDRRRITFVLTRELVDLAGWQGGERFVVSIGTGADRGAFQISRTDRPRTGLKLIPHSQARGFRLHLNLPACVHGIDIPALVDNLPRPCSCRFAMQDAALILTAEARAPVSADGSSVVSILSRTAS